MVLKTTNWKHLNALNLRSLLKELPGLLRELSTEVPGEKNPQTRLQNELTWEQAATPPATTYTDVPLTANASRLDVESVPRVKHYTADTSNQRCLLLHSLTKWKVCAMLVSRDQPSNFSMARICQTGHTLESRLQPGCGGGWEFDLWLPYW